MAHVIRTSGVLLCAMLLSATVHAGPVLFEGFDDIGTLAGAGWAATNNSSPVGLTGWFQGNSGVFPAFSGAPDSYIAANFENAAFGGNISNWLLTPALALSDGMTLSFMTRGNAAFADRLEVRLSLAGSSTDVGATDTSVGDFGLLLLTLNPILDPNGYPDAWTQFSVSLSGLGGPANGRFAFRYFVPDTSVNGDYIGIDDVSVATASVPEPTTTLVLLGIGLAGLANCRRRLR